MKKLNKSQKKTFELFRVACDGLAASVNQQLFDGCRKWYWIGNEVGVLCDFEDCDVLKPDDMVLIIENNMTYDEYAEWRDANLDNNRYINLKSWLMGLRHDMLKEENGHLLALGHYDGEKVEMAMYDDIKHNLKNEE